MSQLKVNSIVPAGGLPSGSNGGIIQVVTTHLSSAATFIVGNGATDNITGLSASITPSSSSSKVFVTGYLSWRFEMSQNGAGEWNFAITDGVAEPGNVRGMLFNHAEGSFLAGVAAALKTQTNLSLIHI